MSRTMRKTLPTQLVLGYLLEQLGDDVFGGEITEQTGVRSGSLYPILQRLEAAGWLESEWEYSAVAAQQGRPPRRYYRLTGMGETNARQYCSPGPAGLLERMRRVHEPHAPGAES